MGFSDLFILQLRSWFLDLRPLDLCFEPDLFDLLIFDLLIFDLPDLLILASPFFVLSIRANTLYYVGFARRCNFLQLQTVRGPATLGVVKSPNSINLRRIRPCCVQKAVLSLHKWHSTVVQEWYLLAHDKARVTPANLITCWFVERGWHLCNNIIKWPGHLIRHKTSSNQFYKVI